MATTVFGGAQRAAGAADGMVGTIAVGVGCGGMTDAGAGLEEG